jgi:uncharacterized membrane protein (UPF0136 family)
MVSIPSIPHSQVRAPSPKQHNTTQQPQDQTRILPRAQPISILTLPTQSLVQIGYLLAALTAGGGITGYVRTGSMPSVAAGCTVGALYALGAYRISNKQPYGVELALLASVVLAGSSIPRAIRSQKTLPIGLSVLASFGMWTYASAMARGKNKYL